MNIAFSIQEISVDNSVRFLEKRNNTIMEGNFTKLVYSDDCITVNGLYIHFPVHIATTPNSFHSPSVPSCPIRGTDTRVIPPPPGLLYPVHGISNQKPNHPNKLIITFQPNHPYNSPILQQLILFERALLDYYKEYMGLSKTPVYSLQNQLLTGSMKFYRDSTMRTISVASSPENVHYIIKISGVWETHETIGITYKTLELYSLPAK